MADLNLLERLCTAQGISGDEGAVREVILKEITPFAKSVTVTPLGNLIVEKKGQPVPKPVCCSMPTWMKWD